MFSCQNSQKTKHDLFVEALCYLDPLIKDAYGLTVTEIKYVVSSLAENYDPAFTTYILRYVYWTTIMIHMT